MLLSELFGWENTHVHILSICLPPRGGGTRHRALRFILLKPCMCYLSKNKMKDTARGLREVVEERGGVIELLQREVEELKAALADMETRSSVPIDPGTPVIDPRLEQQLQKV